MATKQKPKPVPVILCPMLRCTYLPATDHRPARVRAYSVGAGNRPGFRVTVGVHDDGPDGCPFARAALALATKLLPESPPVALLRTSEDRGGYLFAVIREYHTDALARAVRKGKVTS